MNLHTTLVTAIILLAFTSGCGSSPFGDDKIKYALETQPQTLEVEQVILTQQQVECGVREELWDPPTQVSSARSSAKLTPKGRELKFDDDVSIGEAEYKMPYVQVRGQFPVVMTEVVSSKDGSKPDTKNVEVKVGVTIAHSCFSNAPLPLMGVKHGKFSQDAYPVFQFHKEGDEWRVDKLLH